MTYYLVITPRRFSVSKRSRRQRVSTLGNSDPHHYRKTTMVLRSHRGTQGCRDGYGDIYAKGKFRGSFRTNVSGL